MEVENINSTTIECYGRDYCTSFDSPLQENLHIVTKPLRQRDGLPFIAPQVDYVHEHFGSRAGVLKSCEDGSEADVYQGRYYLKIGGRYHFAQIWKP